MTAAAFTMVWNEAERLPAWLRHYGRELGRENLHVLDDGSSDGATEGLGPATVVRLPRSAVFDEAARARLVSDYATRLLESHDTVIFSDVDEFIAPVDGAGLCDALAATDAATLTPIGLDVMHRLDREAPLRDDAPILAQRRHARFNATYCKPLVTRTPIAWRPGFHFSDRPLAFGGLLLFHTRYADRNAGLARLAQSRQVKVHGEAFATHWSDADSAFLATLEAAGRADFRDLRAEDVAAWERRLSGRLAQAPPNAVEVVRDLPDRHPSHYRLDDRFAHVG